MDFDIFTAIAPRLKDVPHLTELVKILMEAIEASPSADKAKLFQDLAERVMSTPGAAPSWVQIQMRKAHELGLLEGTVSLVCQAAKGVMQINKSLPPGLQKATAGCTKCWVQCLPIAQNLAQKVAALAAKRKSAYAEKHAAV